MADTCYFFPASFLIPGFEKDGVQAGRFGLAKRKWGTSTFDFATLATKHKLHLPYQLMDVLVEACNCEIQVDHADSLDSAKLYFESIRVGLYVQQITPFLCPYVTTVSINDYSGINERDTALSRNEEPKIPSPFSSRSTQLEAWPVELSMQCVAIPKAFEVSEQQFEEAADFAEKWFQLCSQNGAIRTVSSALTTSGRLESHEQSILHMWTAMEALFPKVSTEVSFKIALYLAQLCAPQDEKREFHSRAKKAYSIRSKIAHGSSKKFRHDDWLQSWRLILSCVSAIAVRNGLPTEEELLNELLCGGA